MKLLPFLLSTFLFTSFCAQKDVNTKPIKAHNSSVQKSSNPTVTVKGTTVKNEPQHLSYKSPTTSETEATPLIEGTEFVETPATKFSDPNYEKNVEKSKLQEERLNAKPTLVSVKLTDDQRIDKYEKELLNYQVNSVEYNQISAKIEHLKSKN